MSFIENIFKSKEKAKQKSIQELEQAQRLFPESTEVAIIKNGNVENGWVIMSWRIAEEGKNIGLPEAVLEREEDGGLMREEYATLNELKAGADELRRFSQGEAA